MTDPNGGKKLQVKDVFKNGDTLVVVWDDGTMVAHFALGNKLIQKPFRGGYVKFKSYPIEGVLPFISFSTRKPERIYDGFLVKMGSVRYRCFKEKGIRCIKCGLQGLYFTLERNLSATRWHFNLYGLDEDGNEVMLTKDHIIPASRGGSDGVENMQTMCSQCNTEKGTKVSVEDRKNGKSKKQKGK